VIQNECRTRLFPTTAATKAASAHHLVDNLGGIPCVAALTFLFRAIGLPPVRLDRAFFAAGGAWILGSVAASR